MPDPIEDTRLYIYRIDDGETHWVCAENEDEAIKIHAETFGYKDVQEYIDDYSEEDHSGTMHFGVDIRQLTDDEKIWIRMDEGSHSDKIEKTAKEWVQDGKGFLASTVF